RTCVCEPASKIEAALLLERRGQRNFQILSSFDSAHVTHADRGDLSDISTELLEARAHFRDPCTPCENQRRAVLRERWLPHRDARRRCTSPPGLRGFAQRSVSPRQRGTVALKRAKVSARRQREHDVEIPTTRGRRARDELYVCGSKQHGWQRRECVAQSFGDVSVESNAFALSNALEADADLVMTIRFDVCRDVK